MKCEFSRQIFTEFSNIKFHTVVRPLKAGLIHADGRTDMIKVTGAIRDYRQVSKNQ